MSDLTLILQKMERGDPQAADQLMPLVYDELRKIAAGQMARESAGQTLQPTALVHEAWLRLGGNDQPTWQNRAHFFGAAAEAMRRILIDRARHRRALRHGGGQERLNMDDLELAAATDNDDQLLAVHEALDKLAAPVLTLQRWAQEFRRWIGARTAAQVEAPALSWAQRFQVNQKQQETSRQSRGIRI